MPLIRSGEAQLVDAINASATLGLTPATVSFSTPSVYTPASGASNATAKITALTSAPVRGATRVLYRRLPLTSQFTDANGVNPLVIPTPKDVSYSHDLVPNINRFCGFELTTADIEQTVIDRSTMTVLIQATPNSIGWTGSVIAKLVDGDSVLPSVFTNTDLSGTYSYPNANTNIGQASIYSYSLDFSEYAPTLLTITANNLPLQSLATWLNTLTPDKWSIGRAPSNFNLNEAEFVYNGLNVSPLYPGNQNYSRLLVVRLSFYCNNFGGLLYFHYSV